MSASGTEKVEFAGEVWDSTIGLYYIFARYMDSELGRWLSLDPELGKLSMPQSMNRYVYCVNNPLRFTDPTGEWFEISLKDVSKWWHENWQTVAMVALCVAVTVATGGAGGGIAAGMLYGAIAGAGTNMLTYSVQTALAV